MISIAIDGPGGAGKSTAAKAAAKRCGLHYVDTGAMYRGIGVWLVRNGIDLDSQAAVAEAIAPLDVEVTFDEAGQHILVNGEDLTPFIRTPEASDAASRCSAYGEVRAKLLDLQQGLGAKYDIIMDGRDIGTVILPNADLKIFLTADAEERGRRRYLELLEKGQTGVTLEQTIEDIKARDYRDSHREVAPLRQAEDALFLDTTHMSLDEVIDRVCALAEETRARKEAKAESLAGFRTEN